MAKAPGNPAPLDLTGVTLVGDDGASWASIVGNGASIDAPIGAAVAAPAQAQPPIAPARSPSAPPAQVEPAVVALRDLSSKPLPPVLDQQLLSNYPATAKLQGRPGKALVTAQIDADGVVRNVRILSESDAGFGAACRRTLQGSKWSAPRDRRGNAVATQIRYACDFRVDG